MSRHLSLVLGLIALGVAAILLSHPAEAQNPQQFAAMRQELQETRAKLDQAQQQLVSHHDQLREARRQLAGLTEELRLEKQDDRGEAGTVRRLRKQLVTMQGIKYAHYSVWRRRPFVPATAANAFLDDVYRLLAPQSAPRGVWAGGTSVPNDAGGELTLLMIFDDREGHKKYMEDPATRRFLEKHGQRWEMVKALDVLVR